MRAQSPRRSAVADARTGRIIMELTIGLIILGLLGVIGAFAMLRQLRHEFIVFESQVGLHYADGKLRGVLPPGRHVFWRKHVMVDNVDTRLQHVVVASQEVLTADGAAIRLSATL